MKVSGLLHGGAVVIKKYQVAQDVSVVGIPLLASTGDEAGLDASTATNAADMVGINYDLATYLTAQQAAGSSPEAMVAVAINPDVIIKARLSGGATVGTALVLYDVTTATTDGLDVTTGDDWGTPEFDEGAVWGYDGPNAGQIRKITTGGGTSATVTVAFDNDHQVGDNFLRAPFWPMDDGSTVTLTSDLSEIDCSAAVATAADLLPIEILHKDLAGDGRLTSAVLMVPGDHFLSKRS